MKTIPHHSNHIRRKSLDPAYAQEKASAPRLHWGHPRGCLPGQPGVLGEGRATHTCSGAARPLEMRHHGLDVCAGEEL